MKAPLDQFAERIIRNGEVREFIQGLIEKGVSPANIFEAAMPTDTALASLNALAASGTPLTPPEPRVAAAGGAHPGSGRTFA